MIILIQARFSSTRLKGKVLKEIAGKVLIDWILDRLEDSELNLPVAVITSKDNSDDAIYNHCRKRKTLCFRGELENVISRYIDACSYFNHSEFVRICADSPLIDTKLIKIGVDKFNQNNVDIVSNVKIRTFPKGQSVEVLTLKSLIDLKNNHNLDKSEKEHVTLGIYKREKIFKIINFESLNSRYSNLNLSVDSKDDFIKIQEILEILKNNPDSYIYDWLDFSKLFIKKFNS